jgi:putative DNA primase/helicase
MTANQPDTPAHDVLVDVLQAHINKVATCAVKPYKRPVGNAWQKQFRTMEQLNHDHGGTNPRYVAYGVQTGTLSGGLEMWELESDYAHLVDDLEQAFADHDRTELWERINACTSATPSGGIHFIWRPEWNGTKPDGNKKLARTETGEPKAETRGEGGMFVGPGSSGTVHPSGNPWRWRTGGWNKIPTVTLEEREFTFNMLGMFDDYRKPQPAPAAAASMPPSELSDIGRVIQGDFGGHQSDDGDNGLAPGEDFNQRADWKQDILPDWPEHSRDNHYIYLTRPGKSVAEGPSATISLEDQRLYVFTTSTDFESEQPYSKFGAYTQLTEGSTSPDAFSRAASKLRKQGYGTPRKPKTTAKAGNPSGSSQDGAQRASVQVDAQSPSTRPSGQLLMAYRLEQQYTGRLMFVGNMGWYVWDGKRWAHDEKDQAKLAVTDVLQRALAESLGDEQLRKDVRSCERASGINGVLDIASALPGFRVAAGELDANPYQLNTPAGTLDLNTLELKPHDPADRITKITTGGYDPNTDMTHWQNFLDDVLPDKEIQAFLQRYAGLALIGAQREHVMVIATNKRGRNGKGSFGRAMLGALGEYAVTATSELLVKDRQGNKGATEYSALMVLRGARWADMSELDEGARINEPLMKSLTGGDAITTKYMHKDFITFQPSHSFFMQTNHLPKIDSDSTAAWSRVRAVPFDQDLYGREDPTVEDRIHANLDAVVTWAVEGLRDYQSNGHKLNAPVAVLAKTSEWRNDNDPIARFVEEECVLGAAQTVANPAIKKAYDDWARENGEELKSQNALSRELGKLEGVKVSQYVGSNRGMTGIGLRAAQQEKAW